MKIRHTEFGPFRAEDDNDEDDDAAEKIVTIPLSRFADYFREEEICKVYDTLVFCRFVKGHPTYGVDSSGPDDFNTFPGYMQSYLPEQ